MSTITDVSTAQLPNLVAGLVREGLTFKVTRDFLNDDRWVITFTGGF